MSPLRRWFGMGTLLVAPMLTYAACTADSSTQGTAASAGASGTSGAAGTLDSGVDAALDAREDLGGWRPIEGGIQELPMNNLPNCGDGCRILLGAPVDQPAEYSHVHDDPLVADGDIRRILVGDTIAGSSMSVAFAADPEGLLGPAIYGRQVAYARVQGADNWVEVVDLDTQKVRIYAHVTRVVDAFDLGIMHVGLNSKYVFWIQDHKGLFRADLKTGEIRQLNQLADECDRFCATDRGMVCGSISKLRVLLLDQETGDPRPIDDGGAEQVDARCSRDRKRVVWIDYRDPPGQTSSYDGYRNAGEVYMHDFDSGETRRLTHDSPSNLRGKVRPSIDGDRVIWLEQDDGWPPNPTEPQQLYEGNTIALFDITTQRRCRLGKQPLQSRLSLHGNEVYGYWLDAPINKFQLAAIDLTHPSFSWACEDGLPAFPQATP